MPSDFERIQAILVENTGIKPEKITLETTFDDLAVDSIEVLELVMALEAEYQIMIPDADMEKLASVASTIEYVQLATKANQ